MRRLNRFARVMAAVVLAVAVFGARALPAASTCEFSGIERVIAVGDVHGAYDRFFEILRVAGVVDAEARWIGGVAHLVQLGDVVDRGPDSRKALDLLRRLEREAKSAGGAVHPLLGNHEVMRMLGDLRYTQPGEYDAFTSANSEKVREDYLKTVNVSVGERDQLLQKTPLGLVEMRLAFGRDGDYGRWLRQLATTVTIDNFVFVHGGISPAVASMGCEAINDRVHRELTNDLDKTRATPASSLAARADGPLWYRGLVQEPDDFASQVQDIVSKLHARAIVVAHTVTSTNRVSTRFDGRVVELDTGMQSAYVPDGRASALEIRGGVVTAIYVDRRDPVAVRDAIGDR